MGHSQSFWPGPPKPRELKLLLRQISNQYNLFTHSDDVGRMYSYLGVNGMANSRQQVEEQGKIMRIANVYCIWIDRCIHDSNDEPVIFDAM